MTHDMLSDKCLIHDGLRSRSNDMSYPTETPFPDLLEQVEASCERPSFRWDRITCDTREHYAVSAVNPTHCDRVEVPCLTTISEK